MTAENLYLVSFWATEMCKYSKCISGEFPEHFAKEVLSYKASKVEFRRSQSELQLYSADDSQNFVTRSVFELQKCVSTQNASRDNFKNILLNKFYQKGL